MNIPLREIEAVRSSALIGDLVQYGLAFNLPGDGDEALFRKHYGHEGSFLYWGNFLHGVVGAETFVQRLAIARAERWERIDVTRMALQRALVEAHQADETFFRGDLSEIGRANHFHEIKKPELIKLIGRKAADRLQDSPTWRHLVPDTLAAFLRGERPKSEVNVLAPAELPKVKPGPKGGLTARAAGAMLADLRSGAATVASLRSESQKVLAFRYNVGSRTTALEALKMAVSQFRAVSNSDK